MTAVSRAAPTCYVGPVWGRQLITSCGKGAGRGGEGRGGVLGRVILYTHSRRQREDSNHSLVCLFLSFNQLA